MSAKISSDSGVDQPSLGRGDHRNAWDVEEQHNERGNEHAEEQVVHLEQGVGSRDTHAGRGNQSGVIQVTELHCGCTEARAQHRAHRTPDAAGKRGAVVRLEDMKDCQHNPAAHVQAGLLNQYLRETRGHRQA